MENLKPITKVNGESKGKYPLDEHHTPKQLFSYTSTSPHPTSATELVHQVKEDLATVRASGSLDTENPLESRVLVIYTGGTIGMKCVDGVYCPVAHYLPQAVRSSQTLNDTEYVEKNYGDAHMKPACLPPVRHIKKRVVYWMVEYEPLLDSSDMTFDDWIRIGNDIHKSYHSYDGFVILHGTDTLAYTACSLSFMLENLGKPVVITGSQIPVCEVRSDGRENFVGALIVAGNFDIPEVTVYFDSKLFRGNRVLKVDNNALEAFDSPNMAPLAHFNITINVSYESIFRSTILTPFCVQSNLCRNVGLLRIFPSMSIETVRASLQPPVQGVVLQTFGAGNIPSRRMDLIEEIRNAVKRGCIVVNCSQCLRGHVDVHYYTGKILYDVGVISGSDMTAEAALTKLSYVLGKEDWTFELKKRMMQKNIRGEITVAFAEKLQDFEIVPQMARFLHLSTSLELKLLRDALFPPLVCHAANSGDVDLLETLYENGANLSATDYNGRNALHVAAGAGQTNAVLYMLKKGVGMHSRDRWDENPLVSAVRSKNLACIETLKKAGAMIAMNPVRLGVELCLCANCGDLEALRAWITAGADINQADYDGRTALHLAALAGHNEVVMFLTDNGANPSVTDWLGQTPLHLAEKKGMVNIAEHLKKCEKKSSSM